MTIIISFRCQIKRYKYTNIRPEGGSWINRTQEQANHHRSMLRHENGNNHLKTIQVIQPPEQTSNDNDMCKLKSFLCETPANCCNGECIIQESFYAIFKFLMEILPSYNEVICHFHCGIKRYCKSFTKSSFSE